MTRGATRTRPCTRVDAAARLTQAEALVDAASLVLERGDALAAPGVVASLAVLAGIAASDAACCASLRLRARGQSHDEAARLLATVSPRGAAMAKDLRRLLARKDDSHYGTAFVSRADAERMVEWAQRLIVDARAVIES